MSRLYDTVEPSVIDEDMLQKAVEEQGPKDEAGKIAKKEGINFGDVLLLRLDFKNILKIDNLWEFTTLTKLQLDNNIIEKIEGLDVLVNLVWLDLSFNNIEVIEGLNKLSKLEDLTLYNNRISKIENIEQLKNLQVFSIGNNDVQDIKDILYLRQFPKLKTLNINNNPLCSAIDNFKQYVAAFLPHLEFLDYRLLDEQTKTAAYDKYQTQVEEQIDKDNKARLLEEDNERKSKELELHQQAYVEYLNTDKLFEDMYADDPEGNKLNEMPGVDEMLIVFKEKIRGVCQQLFDFGLGEYEKRKAEVDMFWECVNEAKQENKETGMKHIEDFMAEKKRVFIELQHMTDPKMVENKILEFTEAINSLWDKLMGLELQLVDQLEEVIKDFERNMQDLVSTFLENVQAFLGQAREHENVHNEKMMECASSTLEKAAKNELDEDVSEDLKMLLVDKDTVQNAVTTSHDVHLLKIDNKEDDITTRINGWLKNMIDTIHREQEIQRNRTRVTEINHLVDHLRDEVDNLDIAPDDEAIQPSEAPEVKEDGTSQKSEDAREEIDGTETERLEDDQENQEDEEGETESEGDAESNSEGEKSETEQEKSENEDEEEENQEAEEEEEKSAAD